MIYSDDPVRDDGDGEKQAAHDVFRFSLRVEIIKDSADRGFVRN